MRKLGCAAHIVAIKAKILKNADCFRGQQPQDRALVERFMHRRIWRRPREHDDPDHAKEGIDADRLQDQRADRNGPPPCFAKTFPDDLAHEIHRLLLHSHYNHGTATRPVPFNETCPCLPQSTMTPGSGRVPRGPRQYRSTTAVPSSN